MRAIRGPSETYSEILRAAAGSNRGNALVDGDVGKRREEKNTSV